MLKTKEDSLEFLKSIGLKLLKDAKHNEHLTAHPLFCVRQTVGVYGIDTNYSDNRAWISNYDSEDVYLNEPPSLVTYIFENYDTSQDPTPSDEDVQKEYEEWLEENFTETAYYEYKEIVTTFLTRESAELYIEEKRHRHSGSLSIYVDSACRNSEMRNLREALKILAKKDKELNMCGCQNPHCSCWSENADIIREEE